MIHNMVFAMLTICFSSFILPWLAGFLLGSVSLFKGDYMVNERLCELIRGGQKSYLQDLIIQNEGIIEKYARRYGRGIVENEEDLRQECRLAMCKAATQFNPNGAAPFIAFAIPYLKHACLQYIRENAPVRIPQSRISVIKRYSELTDTGASDSEIMEQMRLRSYKDLSEIRRQAGYLNPDHVLSLDAPHGESEEGETCTLGDLLADPEDRYMELVDRMETDRLMLRIETLPPIEREIVKMRMQDEPVTLSEIAKKLNLSIAEVRKAKADAYQRLRKEIVTVEIAEKIAFSSSGLGRMQRSFTSGTELAALTVLGEI